MNYSQNTGYTNSTKKLLCAWIPEHLYKSLCTHAEFSGKTITQIVIQALEKHNYDY